MYIGNDLSRGRSTLYYFDASGSETSITTATRPAVAISYTVGWVAVYLNGVRLHDTDYTATTGNSITAINPALVSGDVVIIEAAHTFSVSDSVPATGGTFTGAVTGTTIDATTDFTVGNLVIAAGTITDTSAVGLTINSTNADITLGQDTTLAAGKDLETSTTGKIKMKGSFMQNSVHQSWVLGG